MNETRTPSDEVFGRWLERFLEELLPLERSCSLAQWKVSTSGRPEDAAKLDRIERAYRGLLANPERYRFLKTLAAEGNVRDPLLARQLRLLLSEFEATQMDGPTLDRLVRMRVEIENLYNTFRATLGETRASDNHLRQVLRTGTSTEEVRAAWEAAKGIGPQAAPRILDLVRLRNSVARSLGYGNFQEMSLRLDELDPEWLFRLLDELADVTSAPYAALKERIDAGLAARFDVAAGELMPWHYGDPFFQEVPTLRGPGLDGFYREADLPALTLRFYQGLGLDIRDVLEESDLFEREGKCQHAFCIDIDKRGDVRVLANVRPDEHWMGTMLHEFGHAAYDKEFDSALPHLLRGPAHTFTTEAVAMLFGRASKDRRFLTEVAGADPARAGEAAAAVREELRAERLIFLRWALVVVHFERELYRDPEGDLVETWWSLVERFQGLRRPAGRQEPDWATKIHIATSPVYYQNYILGELTASQLEHHLLSSVLGSPAEAGVGALIGRREVGEFLREKVFLPGRRYRWDELLDRALGGRLDPAHFLESTVDSRQSTVPVD